MGIFYSARNEVQKYGGKKVGSFHQDSFWNSIRLLFHSQLRGGACLAYVVMWADFLQKSKRDLKEDIDHETMMKDIYNVPTHILDIIMHMQCKLLKDELFYQKTLNGLTRSEAMFEKRLTVRGVVDGQTSSGIKIKLNALKKTKGLAYGTEVVNVGGQEKITHLLVDQREIDAIDFSVILSMRCINDGFVARSLKTYSPDHLEGMLLSMNFCNYGNRIYVLGIHNKKDECGHCVGFATLAKFETIFFFDSNSGVFEFSIGNSEFLSNFADFLRLHLNERSFPYNDIAFFRLIEIVF